jgi:hypothetical protein
MVHHVVEFVAVAVLLISKVDGGGGAVLPIDVVTDPHELSEEVNHMMDHMWDGVYTG